MPDCARYAARTHKVRTARRPCAVIIAWMNGSTRVIRPCDVARICAYMCLEGFQQPKRMEVLTAMCSKTGALTLEFGAETTQIGMV